MKKPGAFFTVLFTIFLFTVQAQPGSGEVERTEENQQILDVLDSLTYNFYTKKGYTQNRDALRNNGFRSGEIPIYSDSVYRQRLAVIPSPFNFDYNEFVRSYIDLYGFRKRAHVEKMLGLARMYFPLFEEALDKYDLPLELKYLPIIESALNPQAVSRVGATGLWQFMYPTGKMYGLEINSYVDERRDPYKATDAACRYLRDLYELYGDWALVLAAYNSGPGNVNKAIRRSGGKTDFWEIRPYLPRETRGYVPAFIGAAYVFQYSKEHNLAPLISSIYSEPVDTIHVYQNISLKKLAAAIDADEEELAFLNPALKLREVPYTGKPYALTVPVSYIMAYEDARKTLFAPLVADVEVSDEINSDLDNVKHYDSKPAENVSKPVYKSTTYSPKPKTTYTAPAKPSTAGKTKLIYTVKAGDNLGYISGWYGCSIRDIQGWNNISGTRIWVGQKLDVYVPNGTASKYRNIDNLSFHQKQQLSGNQASTSASNSGQYMDYTIKYGDTLWDITKKYPKNSVESLKKVNNITNLSVIKPGYVIKVAI